MKHILAALASMLAPNLSHAQRTAQLIGTWRLASFLKPAASGRAQPYWDDKPAGLIIYTADGHVSVQLYDSRRRRLGVTDWQSASPKAAHAAFTRLIAYFGKYTVDTRAQTVTHLLEGAMAPDWIGSKLVRGYRFIDNDHMELRVVTDASGQRVNNGSVLLWQRVTR